MKENSKKRKIILLTSIFEIPVIKLPELKSLDTFWEVNKKKRKNAKKNK